jgi:hypothetical protein
MTLHYCDAAKAAERPAQDLRISGRASGGKSLDVELTKNAPRFFSGVRRCKNQMKAPRMPKNQLDRSLSCGRSA